MTGMEQQFLGSFVGALGTLAAVFLTINKLKAGFKKEIEEKIKLEIDSARDLAEADLKAVDLKLDSLSKDISNLDIKIDRDIANVKAVYNSEIKSLAEKIENLREEIRHSHGQLVGLLSKLVTDRD